MRTILRSLWVMVGLLLFVGVALAGCSDDYVESYVTDSEGLLVYAGVGTVVDADPSITVTASAELFVYVGVGHAAQVKSESQFYSGGTFDAWLIRRAVETRAHIIGYELSDGVGVVVFSQGITSTSLFAVQAITSPTKTAASNFTPSRTDGVERSATDARGPTDGNLFLFLPQSTTQLIGIDRIKLDLYSEGTTAIGEPALTEAVSAFYRGALWKAKSTGTTDCQYIVKPGSAVLGGYNA